MKNDSLDLYAGYGASLRFDGATFEPEKDRERLTCQLERVRNLMRDGEWRTLEEIANKTGDASIASISARLRDLRKKRFGAHTVARQRRGEAKRGLFEYRLEGRRAE